MNGPMGLGPFEFVQRLMMHPRYLLYGLPFSFTLLGILFSHEMGHYMACRYYGIRATLPYFIPVPFGPIGTFGAFIKIKSPIMSKKALFDVGIAGPIAGFVMAVPAMVVGIWASRVVDLSAMVGGYAEVYGEPLLYQMLARLILGDVKGDVFLHPIAFAAWFGCLATAFNLFPIGQLDGGHILYSVIGRRFRYLSRFFWWCTIAIGAWLWPGWLFWAFLTLMLGLDHPRTWFENDSLGTGRMILFLLAVLMFILCFIPVPISIQQIGG
ncbi:MAG: site-2 protease family protein [Acidobacteriota bacterium]